MLIRGLDRDELPILDAVLAGRRPIVSTTAAKEYLRGGSVAALRDFLVSRNDRIAVAAAEGQVAELQARARALGRRLGTNDGRVAGSAISEEVSLLTTDRRLYNLLVAIGERVEYYS